MKRNRHLHPVTVSPLHPCRRLLITLCLSLCSAASSFAVAPPADDSRAQLAAGKSRFDKLCVSCHGPDGSGKNTYGPRLQDRSDLSETLIRERIMKGKHGDHAMPPWGTVLKPEQVDQLVAYVSLLRQPAAGQPSTPLTPFDLNDPARIEVGRKRFAKTCAGYCHGSEGIGGRAPDFKGRTDLSAELAFTTISNGRQGADVMPPWGSAFSEEEIWELVAYLQYLGRQKVE